MSIVATEIEIMMGSATKKTIWYRCQDSSGIWHRYGPVITTDPNFDAEAYKTVIEDRVGTQLAEAEANEVIQ